MNTKILVSILVIGLTAVAIGGAMTGAWFSDTETSENNVIAAGSLDLTLNDQNGGIADAVVTINDMKPDQTKYSEPITLDVSNNPGKLYKHIMLPECITKDLTEPECTDQGGVWNDDTNTCTWERTDLTQMECEDMEGTWNLDRTCTFTDENYLPAVTWFDLEIWDEENSAWVIMIPDHEVTVDDIASNWIYLGEYGEYPNGAKVTIRQSFHMFDTAGNEYQGDSCEFTEEFKVLQTNAPPPNNCWDPKTTDNVCLN